MDTGSIMLEMAISIQQTQILKQHFHYIADERYHDSACNKQYDKRCFIVIVIIVHTIPIDIRINTISF